MTRKEFERIDGEEGFDSAMSVLWEECNCVTTYEDLKEYAIDLLQNDNVMFALHILNAIYESSPDSDWYCYDYSAGTCDTPVCLVDIEDVETHVGFDDEIEINEKEDMEIDRVKGGVK